MVTCKITLPRCCLHVAEKLRCLQAKANEYLTQFQEEDTDTELSRLILLNQLLHSQKVCSSPPGKRYLQMVPKLSHSKGFLT